MILHCVFLFATLFAQEEPYLNHVHQLTFPAMNFEKAGEAYFSPDGKSIIFQAIPKGEKYYQMYVMDLEEKIPHLVSTGTGKCTCGFFRPDGKKILFASSHENEEKSTISSPSEQYKWEFTRYMNIYEADLDGSSLTQLTWGPAYHAECSYSPDGEEILFASDEDGTMNLYIMDRKGENKRQLTKSVGCYNGGPFFSPDGQSIIFRGDREKPDHLQLYLIDKEGLHERQLTFDEGVNWAPYWHPNGKVLAYTTSLQGEHQYEIYLLNIETGARCRLTNHPSFDGLPVFNADGTKIMWTSKRGEDGTCQIFIADFILPPALN